MKKLVVLLLVLLMVVGCTPQEAPTSDEMIKDGPKEDESLSLTLGLMPAADIAPILVAQEKGYFKDLGLDVNIEIYTNAMNRQSALQVGELDGTLTDLIAFINNVHNGFDTKIVTSTDGSFPFLVSDTFKEDNNSQKIGMLEVSVTNFLSDEFLGATYKMEKIFIPEIPTRLEMVKNNQLDMAIIPGSIIFGVGDKKPIPFFIQKNETIDKTLIKYNRLTTF